MLWMLWCEVTSPSSELHALKEGTRRAAHAAHRRFTSGWVYWLDWLGWDRLASGMSQRLHVDLSKWPIRDVEQRLSTVISQMDRDWTWRASSDNKTSWLSSALSIKPPQWADLKVTQPASPANYAISAFSSDGLNISRYGNKEITASGHVVTAGST